MKQTFSDIIEARVLIKQAVRDGRIPNSAGAISNWFTLAQHDIWAVRQALGGINYPDRIANVMRIIDERDNPKPKTIRDVMNEVDKSEID